MLREAYHGGRLMSYLAPPPFQHFWVMPIFAISAALDVLMVRLLPESAFKKSWG